MNPVPTAAAANPPRNCPKCDTELRDAVLGGQCPLCMLKVMRDPDATLEVAVSSPPSAGGSLRYVGDYELGEEIGRGGMGVVFKARHLSLHRTVALKVISPEQLASPRAVERFHTEAAAAASLDHPNIVPVYETGECDGWHYFSMKLIEGRSLAEGMPDMILGRPPVTRTHRMAAGTHDTGRNRSEKITSRQPSAVANLVKQIATAVHYAHQHGILHRDLKPGNILIDASGDPHVADFGLARQMETGSSLTISGEIMGTPAYMAPEQAGGMVRQITTASDVFSLGAIFYELLTGRTPFRGETAVETLHAVLHSDPATPRSLNPAVPRDMETICLKCLDKEPAKRYASAQELADELGRFVRGEPIRARAVSTPEKVWRWCRRKPALAASLVLLNVVLVLGVAGIIWQWRQAKANAVSAGIEAAKNRQIARFLMEMLSGVGPSFAMGGDTRMLREILDNTVDRIDKDLKDQPAVEAELRNVIGNVYGDLGEYVKAVDMHTRSLAIERKLHGNEHPDVALSLNNLACVLRRQGKLSEAEAMHREGLAMSRKLLDKEHMDLATSLNGLACALQDQNKLDEAEALHREALAMQKKLLGDESREVATSLTNLANVLHKQNKPAEAEKMYVEALAMQRKVSGNDHPLVALALNNLGQALNDQGKLTEAESTVNEALELYRKLMGNENAEVVATMNTLASVLDKQGRHGDAETILREALAIQRKLPETGHKNSINLLTGLGVTLSSQGKHGDAEPFLRELVEIDRKILKDDDPGLAKAIRSLASCMAVQQKYPEAETLYEEALAISQKALGDADPDRVPMLVKLVGVLEKQGKFSKAEHVYREILATMIELMGNNNPLVNGLRTKLALSLEMQGKYPDAEPLLREAREKTGVAANNDPSAQEAATYTLAQNLYRQNKFAEAEPLFREVIESRLGHLGPDHDEVLVPTGVRASLLADWAWTERGSLSEVRNLKPEIPGRAMEAERVLRECLAIRLGGPNANVWRTGGVRSRLGGALLAVALTDPALNTETRQAKFTEAEPLLLEGNEVLQQSKEVGRIYQRDALVRLVRLYEAWQNRDKAAEWQRKLEDFDKPK